MKKLKTIHIEGRRWFDRINGNTHCSAKAYINGEHVLTTDWTYGYNDYYIQDASEQLKKQGLVKLETYNNGISESLWRHCSEHKIEYNTNVADVLKRDMVRFSKEKPEGSES